MLKWVTAVSPATLATQIQFALTTLAIIVALAQTTSGFRPIEVNNGEGRKLFGGYRITPKQCRATKTLPISDPRVNGPTICMFNHECAQRNGEVVGACMDGFLFGACCQIPNTHDVESTLINDAQNAYFQQHQQNKLQLQQTISNPAAAQSYENYGESLQQQSQENNKYQEQQLKPAEVSSSSSNYNTPQNDIYEQSNLDKVYQQLESSSITYPQQQHQTASSSSTNYQQQLPSSSSNYIGEAELEVSSSSSSVQDPQVTAASSIAIDTQQQIIQNDDSQTQETSANTSLQSEQNLSGGGASPEVAQSASVELENDASLHVNSDSSNTNTISEPRPPNFHVHKNSVKISSPSSPPHNDDFVMQVLSTLPPEHEGELITFTTEVPMKISSSLTEQTSSESNSFEEEPSVTQLPVLLVDKPVKPAEPQQKPHKQVEAEQTHDQQQQQHLHKKPGHQQQEQLIQQQHEQQQQQQHQEQLQHHQQQQQHHQQQQQHHQQQQQHHQQLEQHHQQLEQLYQEQEQHHQHHDQHMSSHNHNHLLLDGGEFTHSDITHPGADADLVEDDLQFSTGYGPQPVYVESPNKQPSNSIYNSETTIKTPPAPEDKYVLVQTITNEQLNKKPPTDSNPTTISSITTHVDSIESIILQLNNTNHGPSYNVISQQTPSYGFDSTNSINPVGNYEQHTNYYDSTTPSPVPTTVRSTTAAPTHSPASYYEEIETNRPEDLYAQNEAQEQQNYPKPPAQVPAYLEPVSTTLNLNSPNAVVYDTVSDDKDEQSQSYLQNEYPSSKPVISVSSPTQSYGEDSGSVLDEHTMPINNYNDASAPEHHTSEFNKMPAVGIAYPVDMSYIDEEANTANDGDEQSGYDIPVSSTTTSQKPIQSTPTITYHKLSTQSEPTSLPFYTKLPSMGDTQQNSVASYIGVVTSQNYNNQQPQASVYSQVPHEVSVSSHTTKVEEDYDSTSSYQTAQAEKFTTISYVSESPTTTPSYISSTSTPVANRPQYASTTESLSSSYANLVTASGIRPKPRPKPSKKRPTKNPNSSSTNKTSKPGSSKKPAQPTNSYNQETQSSINYNQKPELQATNIYHDDQPIFQSKPAPQPTSSYNTEPIYTKKPATQPANTYNQKPIDKFSSTYNQKEHAKKPTKTHQQPASTYNNQNEHVKKPAAHQPSNTYSNQNQHQHKNPSAPPSNTYQQEIVAQASNSYNQSPISNKPLTQPTSSYNQNANVNKPVTQASAQPSNSYQQSVTHSNKKPSNTYNTGTIKTKKPIVQITYTYQPQDVTEKQPISTFGQNIKTPVQQPSFTYDQDQYVAASSPTKRPATRKPTTHKKKPVSTSYVTGPTSPRPPTTFGYYDDQVPPLVIADDKLDSFVLSTANAIASASTPASGVDTYQAPVYASSVTPVHIERPQNNYNTHKKPGFVKVQPPTIKPPVPTVLITPKPTVNLVTPSSWSQRPNSDGINSPMDTAYSQTTALPGYGSTSFIYNTLVTRRPALQQNTPEYVNMQPISTNDFDDQGYYGAPQNSAHPAFAQSTTEAVFGVPSDDRPAFPGYYGPTPTYPAFQVPGGEKLDSPIEEETYTSPNDFNNFPPVRNPNLNMSATSSAVTSDLELSTPAFVEDVVLKDKMNTLVHKIVESLQGNFDALADMIDDANNTASGYQADTLQSTAGTTTVTRKTTRKPTRITTTKPKATTKKPVSRSTTRTPTKRPTATTRKPVTRRTTTTTTRKPVTRKPTRKTTTTTTTGAPLEDEIVDEEDEEDVNPSENEIDLDETLSGAGAGGRKFQCGVRPHVKSGRIVGGKGATFGAYPWQVLVRESTWLGLFTKNKCGGVLITNRYIITAAHCQPGFLASLVAVMGEYDISGDLESKRSVTKNVKRVIVHRQYDPATFENDLALLELESTVQFDTHIVPICMPSDHADFTGRMASVTGWGRLKYGGGVPSVLQEVQVPVIENSVCQEMFHTAGHNKKILTSFLCAGYANGQKDSCEGDSGGPLVLQRPDGRYELAGTVSHGIKCAAPYLPGVYMRTTFYKPWLRSITGVK